MNRFNFYDVVQVQTSNSSLQDGLVGQIGTILGMAQNEKTGVWTYSVSIEPDGDVWNIDEVHLQATGATKSRSEFYDGESVKVLVDPVTGEGRAEAS